MNTQQDPHLKIKTIHINLHLGLISSLLKHINFSSNTKFVFIIGGNIPCSFYTPFRRAHRELAAMPYVNMNMSIFGVIPCDTILSSPCMELLNLNLNRVFILFTVYLRKQMCKCFILHLNFKSFKTRWKHHRQSLYLKPKLEPLLE